eukprot:181798_1
MDINTLQDKLDKHLTPKTMHFIKMQLVRSIHATNIVQTIVMLLSDYPHPTTFQCNGVLNRAHIIDDTKNLHKKKISMDKKMRIESFMTKKANTFDSKYGYHGYKPIQILKNWAIYLIKCKPKVQLNKNIQTEDEDRISVEIYGDRVSGTIVLNEIDETKPVQFNETKTANYFPKAISCLLDTHEQKQMQRRGRLSTLHFGKGYKKIQKVLRRLTCTNFCEKPKKKTSGCVEFIAR